MAVDRQGHVAQGRAQLVEVEQEALELGRHRVADGVRDVDRGGALARSRSRPPRPRSRTSERVASSQLNSTSSTIVRARRTASVAAFEHLVARHLQLVLEVDVAGGDEGVDARAAGVAHRLAGGGHVLLVRPGQAGDDHALDLLRHRPGGLEVARRRDREPGLDDVDAESRELLADLHLLARVEGDPRRLLAVAERGVEDQYALVGVLRGWGRAVGGHGEVLLTKGLRGIGCPAHPGVGVGKLPLPGEEPTKPQERAPRQDEMGAGPRHGAQDTVRCLRAQTGPAGRDLDAAEAPGGSVRGHARLPDRRRGPRRAAPCRCWCRPSRRGRCAPTASRSRNTPAKVRVVVHFTGRPAADRAGAPGGRAGSGPDRRPRRACGSTRRGSRRARRR